MGVSTDVSVSNRFPLEAVEATGPRAGSTPESSPRSQPAIMDRRNREIRAMVVNGRGGELLQRLDSRQHFLGVALDLHAAPFARSTPLASNRKVLRSTPMYLRPYRLFSRITSKAWHSGFVGVGQQGERKALNLAMKLSCVRTLSLGHAEHLGAGLAELLVEVAEVLAFLGAARRVVLRVEVQHQRLAACSARS